MRKKEESEKIPRNRTKGKKDREIKKKDKEMLAR